MLYTACISAIGKSQAKMKHYYVMNGHGSDVVVPDKLDLDQYRNGVVTWQGFKLNYSMKLMRPEAEEWMRGVSVEAVREDAILVSDEENGKHCYRILLAETMINTFSGQMNLHYMGELDRS